MRHTFPITIAAGAGALLLSLSACSSSANHATDAGSGKQTSTSTAALSEENIAKIVASYTGEDSRFPASFGAAEKAPLKIGWSAARKANELNARVGVAIRKQTEALGGSFSELDANGDVPTRSIRFSSSSTTAWMQSSSGRSMPAR